MANQPRNQHQNPRRKLSFDAYDEDTPNEGVNHLLTTLGEGFLYSNSSCSRVEFESNSAELNLMPQSPNSILGDTNTGNERREKGSTDLGVGNTSKRHEMDSSMEQINEASAAISEFTDMGGIAKEIASSIMLRDGYLLPGNDVRSFPSSPNEYLAGATLLQGEAEYGIIESGINDPENCQIENPFVADVGLEEMNADVQGIKRSRRYIQHSQLTNKRQINQDKWIKNEKKKAVNAGLEYKDVDGNVITKAKEMKASCDKSCRRKCIDKISDATRGELFKKFWSLESSIRRWNFLANMMEIYEPKQRQKNDFSEDSADPEIESEPEESDSKSKKRKPRRTIYYNLKFKDEGNAEELKEVKVCRTMFLTTFAVSEAVIKTICSKMSTSQGCDISPDKRGKHHIRPKAISIETQDSVIDHINLYPRVESHYLRARTQREYLEDGLTVRKMFDQYKDWIIKSKPELKKRASFRQYLHIFKTKFNISFFKPKKDRCNICECWKNCQDLPDKTSALYLELEKNNDEHNSDKKIVRKIKEDAIKRFLVDKKNSKDLCVACFDYEKCLPIPRSETNAFYYKRKVSVSNFTIYDIGRHIADCYCYDETVAKKGSNEVGSLLYDYFKKKAADGINKFELFSDNCGGQNRNRFVFGLLVYSAMTIENFSVTHTFLQCGHTQMEGDSVHALIERRSTGRDIYTPDMWYSIIKNAKVTGEPYRVIEVKQDMIFDLKRLVNNHKCTLNTKGQKIAWSKIKVVHCDSNHPGKFFYKVDYNGEFSELDIFSNPQIRCIKKFHLEKAYPNDLKISSAKYKDLKSLCDSNAIPPKYQEFYKKLAPETDEAKNAEDIIEEPAEDDNLASRLEKELAKIEKPKRRKNQEKKSVDKKATKRKVKEPTEGALKKPGIQRKKNENPKKTKQTKKVPKNVSKAKNA